MFFTIAFIIVLYILFVNFLQKSKNEMKNSINYSKNNPYSVPNLIRKKLDNTQLRRRKNHTDPPEPPITRSKSSSVDSEQTDEDKSNKEKDYSLAKTKHRIASTRHKAPIATNIASHHSTRIEDSFEE